MLEKNLPITHDQMMIVFITRENIINTSDTLMQIEQI